MLIKIDERGLKLLEEKTQQDVKGQPRWYYVGAGDEVTALAVAKGLALTVGQIWDASSGNELGFTGFCRKAHEGKKIGEQLFVKSITPDFIVECVKNDTDNNGNGEVTRFWTIFKMKRFDLSAYHQEMIDRAATALKAEIAAACA